MNGGEDCKPLSRDEEFKASVRPFCVGNPACPGRALSLIDKTQQFRSYIVQHNKIQQL